MIEQRRFSASDLFAGPITITWLYMVITGALVACGPGPAAAAPGAPSPGAPGRGAAAPADSSPASPRPRAPGASFVHRPPWNDQSFSGHKAHEDAVVSHVNALRKSLGLAELVPDERLRVGARQHTVEMIQKGYYAHESPAAAWKTPAQRACHAGFLEPFVSENIGLITGYPDVPQALFDSWKGSPGHYRNMVDPKVSRIGVGVGPTQRNGVTVWLATQLFGADSLDLRAIAVTTAKQRVLRVAVTMSTTGDIEVNAWQGQQFAGKVPSDGSIHRFTVDLPLPLSRAVRLGFAVKVGDEMPLVCAHVDVSGQGSLNTSHATFHPLCRRILSVKAEAKVVHAQRRLLTGEALARTQEALGARFFLNKVWGPPLGLKSNRWVRFSHPLPEASVVDFSLILTRLQKDYLRIDLRRPDPFQCP